MRKLYALMAAAGVVFLGACETSPFAVESAEQVSLDPNDAWSCYDPTDPHCSNVPPPGDPNPSAPGIFLGDFTPELCWGGNDSDGDGMHDFCEYQLALSFRPQMSTNPNDKGLRREEYWAARTGLESHVEIIYMFGYHLDYGNDFAGACNTPPISYYFCQGHFGDSEFVVMHVNFDEETSHWVLASMYTAAHRGTGGESSQWWNWNSLEYPRDSKSGWYPRVYVARDKHGSFGSRSSCNSGGHGTDDCSANSDADRFYVGHLRNVGSPSNSLYVQDPVYSKIDPYLYSGWEYFRNASQPFCGWDGSSATNRSNCSTSYAAILSEFAF